MIPLFKVYMSEDARQAAYDTLGTGYVGQGPEVDLFELALGNYTPWPNPVTTNSCTSAIHMVLAYLGIGPGDDVVTTPMTCVATNAPILAVGARPVWADVNPYTGLITPETVARAITPRTRAIIAVDWTGRHPDYAGLRKFGLPIIEDAAHGLTLGADHGDFVCYSFGPIKHLCCVDGGAVSCAPEHVDSLRLLRWYGLDRTSKKDFRCEQDIKLPGMKWHMNDVNAAIGRANLRNIDDGLAAHRANAKTLFDRLVPHSYVFMPQFAPDSDYWVFPLIVPVERDEFVQHMLDRGIQVSQVHARNDKHEAYNFYNGHLYGTEKFDATQVNVPCGWWLSPGDVAYIADSIDEWRPSWTR